MDFKIADFAVAVQVGLRRRGRDRCKLHSCASPALRTAADAPRFPDFLKNRATAVEVLNKGDTKATAAYVEGKTVQQALRRAGPIR